MVKPDWRHKGRNITQTCCSFVLKQLVQKIALVFWQLLWKINKRFSYYKHINSQRQAGDYHKLINNFAFHKKGKSVDTLFPP